MATRVALGESIKRELRQRILAGDLGPGDRVPSEFQLVQQYGVSRSHTRQALRDLEGEGLVVRRRGSGSYVADNFTPNAMAASVRLDTVKISFPEYRSCYVRQVIESFMEHVFAAGLKVTTYKTQLDVEGESTFINSADRMSVAGLVMWLIHDNEAAKRSLEHLIHRRFPVVLVDRCPEGLEVDCVSSDNRALGYELTKALLNDGHRRIGYVTSSVDTASSIRERFRGYSDALAEAGLAPDERYMVRLDERQRCFRVEVNEAMAHRVRPTAFFCINADMAGWLEAELGRLGWTGNEGIALAYVDDQYPSERGNLPRFTLQQDGRGIGSKCAELLLARIADPGRPAERCLIPHQPIAATLSQT